MRKMINGRRYDTETAELVHSWMSDEPRGFDWWNVKLFRKHNGEFFAECLGGAMTMFGQRLRELGGSSWYGTGHYIIPLSDEQASKLLADGVDDDALTATCDTVGWMSTGLLQRYIEAHENVHPLLVMLLAVWLAHD